MTVTDDTIHEQIEAFKAQTESKQYSDLLDQYSSKEASTGRWTPVTKSAWAPRKAATVRAKEIMKRAQHTAVANQKITQAEQVAIGAGTPVVASETGFSKQASRIRVAEVLKEPTPEGQAYYKRLMRHPSEMSKKSSDDGVKTASRIRVAEVAPQDEAPAKKKMSLAKKVAIGGAIVGGTALAARTGVAQAGARAYRAARTGRAAVSGAETASKLGLRGALSTASPAKQAVGRVEALKKGLAASKKKLGRAVFGQKRVVGSHGTITPVTPGANSAVNSRAVGNSLGGGKVKRVRRGAIMEQRRGTTSGQRQMDTGRRTFDQLKDKTKASTLRAKGTVRKTTGDKALNAAMWGSMVPAFMPQHGGNG